MPVTDEQLDTCLEQWDALIEQGKAVSLSIRADRNLLDIAVDEQGFLKCAFTLSLYHLTYNDEMMFEVSHEQMDRLRAWILTQCRRGEGKKNEEEGVPLCSNSNGN